MCPDTAKNLEVNIVQVFRELSQGCPNAFLGNLMTYLRDLVLNPYEPRSKLDLDLESQPVEQNLHPMGSRLKSTNDFFLQIQASLPTKQSFLADAGFNLCLDVAVDIT